MKKIELTFKITYLSIIIITMMYILYKLIKDIGQFSVVGGIIK
jgi:hypothetical protein